MNIFNHKYVIKAKSQDELIQQAEGLIVEIAQYDDVTANLSREMLTTAWDTLVFGASGGNAETLVTGEYVGYDGNAVAGQ